MLKRNGIARYRAADLLMFAVMVAVFEFIAVTAARRWFPNEPYTVSVVPALTAIVMMRWGPWAALHAALGGAVFCLASGARDSHLLIYMLGNLASLGALGLIKLWTPEGVRESVLKSLVMAAAVTLLMQSGRAVIAILLRHPPAAALGFYTTDTITLLFTLVLIWIARRVDGLFEEQNHYLERIRREDANERGGFR